MTFVDTSGWVALFLTKDPQHAAAVDWHRRDQDRRLTSDYVLDELLTLLKVRSISRYLCKLVKPSGVGASAKLSI